MLKQPVGRGGGGGPAGAPPRVRLRVAPRPLPLLRNVLLRIEVGAVVGGRPVAVLRGSGAAAGDALGRGRLGAGEARLQRRQAASPQVPAS